MILSPIYHSPLILKLLLMATFNSFSNQISLIHNFNDIEHNLANNLRVPIAKNLTTSENDSESPNLTRTPQFHTSFKMTTNYSHPNDSLINLQEDGGGLNQIPLLSTYERRPVSDPKGTTFGPSGRPYVCRPDAENLTRALPCLNRGLCLPVPAVVARLSGFPPHTRHYCHCPRGYYGKLCETHYELSQGQRCLVKIPFLDPNSVSDYITPRAFDSNFLGFRDCNKCICFNGKVICSQVWCGAPKCTIGLSACPSPGHSCQRSPCLTPPCFDSPIGNCLANLATPDLPESDGRDGYYTRTCDGMREMGSLISTSCHVYRLRVDTQRLPKGLTVDMACNHLRTHTVLQNYGLKWRMRHVSNISLKLHCTKDRKAEGGLLVFLRVYTERSKEMRELDWDDQISKGFDFPAIFTPSSVDDNSSKGQGIVPFILKFENIWTKRYALHKSNPTTMSKSVGLEPTTHSTHYESTLLPEGSQLVLKIARQSDSSAASTLVHVAISALVCVLLLCALATSLCLAARLPIIPYDPIQVIHPRVAQKTEGLASQEPGLTQEKGMKNFRTKHSARAPETPNEIYLRIRPEFISGKYRCKSYDREVNTYREGVDGLKTWEITRQAPSPCEDQLEASEYLKSDAPKIYNDLRA